MSAPFLTGTLDMPHGFFGREGGVSEGIFASLNCGPGSNDGLQAVQENRAIACGALGAKEQQLCTLYQIHSPSVLVVEQPWGDQRPQADAMVTNKEGVVLGILTADCAPVLLADTNAGVVAAAHAGWKGAFTGVLENTLGAMKELGATLDNIVATIGPCIAQQSYEVGPEFVARLVEADKGNMRFLVPSTRENHSQFDLPGYVAHRLKTAGLRNISAIAMDTCANEKQYFSYRRATLRGEKNYGRQLSAIMVKGQI